MKKSKFMPKAISIIAILLFFCGIGLGYRNINSYIHRVELEKRLDKDFDSVIVEQTGKTLVIFDGGIITTGDVDNFKKYRQDNLSDKQALEMIIERELLYKEAQAQGLTATLKEAQAESDRAKNTLEQYETEQNKKMIQDEIKKLSINESEYWNNYYPKQLIKPLTVGNMKKSIKNKIYKDIINNHSDWGQSEIEKGSKEAYDKAINDLKSKYNLKYINS